MSNYIKTSMVVMLFLLLMGTGQQVQAAYSPFEFALPIEKERFNYAIALIRHDNTFEIMDIDQQNLLAATVNQTGSRVAYTVREDNRIKVFIADTDGTNVKEVCDYRSDTRNISDFIDLRFIKDGQYLVMAKFIKDELAFLEYNVARGRTRFLNKTDWRGAPFTIHALDSAGNGQLVYKITRHSGGDTMQQIWTSMAYEPASSVFMEIESPPTILEIIPDMKNKRIFAVCTDTRHVSVKNVKKSLMLIDNMENDPEVIVSGGEFRSVTMGNDGKYIVWRSSPVGSEPAFKRYNVETGEITDITSGTGEEEGQAQDAPGGAGTAVPGGVAAPPK